MQYLIQTIKQSTSRPCLSNHVAQLLNSQLLNTPDGAQEFSLLSQSMRVAARNFHKRPFHLNKLPPQIARKISSLLSASLDLCIAVRYVQDETFWKKVFDKKYGSAYHKIEQDGLTWKRLFLERHLQHVLESFDPEIDDLNDLLKMVRNIEIGYISI